jgi:hypothetical protein
VSLLGRGPAQRRDGRLKVWCDLVAVRLKRMVGYARLQRRVAAPDCRGSDSEEGGRSGVACFSSSRLPAVATGTDLPFPSPSPCQTCQISALEDCSIEFMILLANLNRILLEFHRHYTPKYDNQLMWYHSSINDSGRCPAYVVVYQLVRLRLSIKSVSQPTMFLSQNTSQKYF